MKNFKQLLRFLKPYWFWASVAPILMLLEVMLDLMQPRLVARIVDQGIAMMDLELIIKTGITMVILAFIGAIGGITNGIFAEKAAQGFSADLRESLFKKIQSYSFGNLDILDTGQLITRLTNDVTQMQEAIVMGLRIFVRAPLLLVGSLIMAFVTSPSLSIIILILMPVELLLVLWIVRKATPLFSIVQEKLDRLNTVMQENLAGVRVVKSFVRSTYEQTRFGQANDQLSDQIIHAGRTVASMFPFLMLILNIGIVGVLWFGGVLVTQGTVQVGQIIAFVNYLSITLFSLMMVSQLTIQLARAEASANRIQEILLSNSRIQDNPQPITDLSWKGTVSFENVSFSYDGEFQDPVLNGISFIAEPGQTVALLGATGSGKSSLVHLIPRFYDVTGGRITVDGIDIRDLDQKELRKRIGIALQEIELFSGTIRENICYGKPDATDEQIISAAKAAEAHEFIMGFPDGYNTILGQRGVNLSGGQKQRIAIARAIVIQPLILILDDSTSAVDVETEVKIQEALEKIMVKSTCFVIAQRISTVLNADKILVLENGEIAAQGTHKQLVHESPIYRDIFESQLGKGITANV
jgi:ATP-binding cassette, subfamily B, multidrug efflux pump